MKLNSEVLEGMKRMSLYENRRVSDMQEEKSGLITEMGFFDDNQPYVGITFDNGKFRKYNSTEFGRLYVADEKPAPPSDK